MTSEDGFIAEADGSVDWLNNFGKDNFDAGSDSKAESEPDDGGYSEFYESIDINVMGRKTFEQALIFSNSFSEIGIFLTVNF